MAGAQNFAAKSIQVDTGFPYYRDRSPESVAAELKANGYGWVRYIVTPDTAADAKFVNAWHKAGLTVSYTVLGNGVYGTNHLPKGWESWKMRFKDPKVSPQGYTYLCLNNPECRRWKKAAIIATLGSISFDGFEIMESYWPAYEGPPSQFYGCLCGHCRDAFRRMFPANSAIPEFVDTNNPDYYQTNPKLYQDWIEFRARSAALFLDDLINGPGRVREKFPELKVGVWGIADDIRDAVAKIKEWEGLDGALVVSTVRPDFYVIQTDWPDWTKPDLKPDYVLGYKPFADVIRAAGSKIPIQVQADIGSNEKCRRGSDWMQRCEAAARKVGFSGVTAYEYHLSLDIYKVPPKPVSAAGASNTVTIIFNKRINATNAVHLANYKPDSGKVISAKVDGNLVKLQVTGRPTTLNVRNLADDPTRRLFKNHPQAVMPKPVSLRVGWTTAN